MDIFLRYSFTIVLAIIGLLAVVIPSTKRIIGIIRLKQIGRASHGVVIESTETSNSDLIKTFKYKIQYEDSSGNLQFLISDDPVLKKYEVGTELKLIYDPKYPSKAIVENSSVYISLGIRIIISFFVLFIIVYTLISISHT